MSSELEKNPDFSSTPFPRMPNECLTPTEAAVILGSSTQLPDGTIVNSSLVSHQLETGGVEEALNVPVGILEGTIDERRVEKARGTQFIVGIPGFIDPADAKRIRQGHEMITMVATKDPETGERPALDCVFFLAPKEGRDIGNQVRNPRLYKSLRPFGALASRLRFQPKPDGIHITLSARQRRGI